MATMRSSFMLLAIALLGVFAAQVRAGDDCDGGCKHPKPPKCKTKDTKYPCPSSCDPNSECLKVECDSKKDDFATVTLKGKKCFGKTPITYIAVSYGYGSGMPPVCADNKKYKMSKYGYNDPDCDKFTFSAKCGSYVKLYLQDKELYNKDGGVVVKNDPCSTKCDQAKPCKHLRPIQGENHLRLQVQVTSAVAAPEPAAESAAIAAPEPASEEIRDSSPPPVVVKYPPPPPKECKKRGKQTGCPSKDYCVPSNKACIRTSCCQYSGVAKVTLNAKKCFDKPVSYVAIDYDNEKKKAVCADNKSGYGKRYSNNDKFKFYAKCGSYVDLYLQDDNFANQYGPMMLPFKNPCQKQCGRFRPCTLCGKYSIKINCHCQKSCGRGCYKD